MEQLKDSLKVMKRYVLHQFGQDVYAGVECRIPKAYYGSTYGGYVVCPDLIDKDSIVYSFGLGDDISFDIELIDRHGISVFAYDPAPETQEWLAGQELPSSFIYQAIALSDQNAELTFYPSPNDRVNYTLVEREVRKGKAVTVPARRFVDLVAENGHGHVDLLKIDIEGAEFKVLWDILDSNVSIGQLVIEFHHKFKIFNGQGVSWMKEVLAALHDHGFRIFDVSSGGIEYSFVHVDRLGRLE